MAQVITPERLAEMLEEGMGSMALHLCSADDLLATIQAGHQAEARVAELEEERAALRAEVNALMQYAPSDHND